MDADFLLDRGDDLAVLGVHLAGFELTSAGSTTVATAGDGAVIVLVLPPQHVAEDTVATEPGPDLVVQAVLSGLSRLAYDVAPGTVVPLTGEEVLAACTALRPGGRALTDTWVELPWRLALAPGDGVSHHPAAALLSPRKVAGVWLSRLASSSGGPMQVLALDRDYAGGADVVAASALTADQRLKVADHTAGRPATASRWELTPLGGSLTASGEWDGFSWSHRATGGRDQYVRVEERVQLYPFGLSGTLTTLTERSHAPGAPAALRRAVTLRLNETVLTSPDGRGMSRMFPFDRVEVGGSVFPGLATPVPDYTVVRATADVEALGREVEELALRVRGQEDLWRPYVDGQLRTEDDLRRAGDPTYQSYTDAVGAAATKYEELGAAETARAAFDELIGEASDLERRAAQIRQDGLLPDGTMDPAAEEQARELEASAADRRQQASAHFVDQGYLDRLKREAADLQAQVDSWRRAVDGLLAAPRTIADAVNLGEEAPELSQAASGWTVDQPALEALRHRHAELTQLSEPTTVTAWPTTADGERLLFPVRLLRGEQVVDVSMAMIAVYDLDLPEVPAHEIPAYRSLADELLPRKLDDAWAGPSTALPDLTSAAAPAAASVLDAHGVLVDLVGASVPKPPDTQLLRTLNLLGGATPEDLFTPSLGRLASLEGGVAGRWGMVVDLPELTQLAGGRAEATAQAVVGFTRDFVERGEAAAAFLEAPAGIVADFTRAADRSGGLAALDVAADVVSRDHGPAALAGLLSSPSPADLIGEAATLLGFSLRDLIRHAVDTLPEPPAPPRIVSDVLDVVDGPPVVTMDWSVPLNDVGAFRVSDVPATPTVLDLHVVSRVDGVVTDCRVNDFALQFPAEGAYLVRLDFGRLRFLQQTTFGVDVTPGSGIGDVVGEPTLDASGRVTTHPPRVSLDGFRVTFGRELELLAELQNAVALGGKVPSIKAGPDGVTAAYSLPVPDVGCGAFALGGLSFHSDVEIPFDGRPVEVGIGFASRDKPFSLSVMSFSGGGYVEVRLGAGGPQIAAALEFGARVEVDFVVAHGEVYALGGVAYVQTGDDVEISGYLRIGGSVSVLELVSVSIELRIALAYQSETRRLVGRATLVLELDLTLWSDSVEIDSGEWVIQGGRSPSVAPESVTTSDRLLDADAALVRIDDEVTDEELAAWQAYRAGGTRRG